MRSKRDERANSTVSCGLQNDIIARHDDVIAATFLRSGRSNTSGQRIFLTCGSKFRLVLLLLHTPANHISRISGSDTVVAHIFRPISYITTRTMELLNGRIRETSHNVREFVPLTPKLLWIYCTKFILWKPRGRLACFYVEESRNRDLNDREKSGVFPLSPYTSKSDAISIRLSSYIWIPVCVIFHVNWRYPEIWRLKFRFVQKQYSVQ
jgi:hypothetical protein